MFLCGMGPNIIGILPFQSSNDWEEESIISLPSLILDLYAVGLSKGDDKS